jgi:hypothetical protein
VTPNEEEALMTLQKAVIEVVELNRAASHPRSLAQLHALLDEVEAATRSA